MVRAPTRFDKPAVEWPGARILAGPAETTLPMMHSSTSCGSMPASLHGVGDDERAELRGGQRFESALEFAGRRSPALTMTASRMVMSEGRLRCSADGHGSVRHRRVTRTRVRRPWRTARDVPRFVAGFPERRQVRADLADATESSTTRAIAAPHCAVCASTSRTPSSSRTKRWLSPWPPTATCHANRPCRVTWAAAHDVAEHARHDMNRAAA